MRIVITGHKGQLGQQLIKAFAGHDVVGMDIPEYDIAAFPAIRDAIVGARPDLVLHPAAYTNVDGCTRDPDLAYRVNGLGTQNIALACQALAAPLVYISTNEVFDGTASEPYLETDNTNPINVYARSKLMGEVYVRSLLSRYYIVRIAWLFSPGGNNFPAKILSLARERGQLSVVTDEVSSPTYAPDLAQALVQLVRSERFGIYHLVNEGICSRYEMAKATLEMAGMGHISVEPITSDRFQRLSKPPKYAPLRNFAASEALGIRLRPWRDALADFLSHA